MPTTWIPTSPNYHLPKHEHMTYLLLACLTLSRSQDQMGESRKDMINFRSAQTSRFCWYALDSYTCHHSQEEPDPKQTIVSEITCCLGIGNKLSGKRTGSTIPGKTSPLVQFPTCLSRWTTPGCPTVCTPVASTTSWQSPPTVNGGSTMAQSMAAMVMINAEWSTKGDPP